MHCLSTLVLLAALCTVRARSGCSSFRLGSVISHSWQLRSEQFADDVTRPEGGDASIGEESNALLDAVDSTGRQESGISPENNGFVSGSAVNSTETVTDNSGGACDNDIDRSAAVEPVVEAAANTPVAASTTVEPATTGLISSNDVRVVDPEISSLLEKYKGRMVCCVSPLHPHCDILLCGTMHVAKSSSDMVQDAIRILKPNYVMLELCEARVDSLCEYAEHVNVTLSSVVRETFHSRSLKVFGMGLLTWMQVKAANVVGSKLGGELAIAAKEGLAQGAHIVLGDRLYNVTIQRLFDRMLLLEKIKFVFIMLWEVLTMSLLKLKDYIKKTENDVTFIKAEIARFKKFLPSFADVIINERDQYMAETLNEISRVGFIGYNGPKRGRILAVVGAGHMEGIQQYIASGGISDDRVNEIASSSKQSSQWPGRGMFQIVRPEFIYPPETPPSTGIAASSDQKQQQEAVAQEVVVEQQAPVAAAAVAYEVPVAQPVAIEEAANTLSTTDATAFSAESIATPIDVDHVVDGPEDAVTEESLTTASDADVSVVQKGAEDEVAATTVADVDSQQS